MATVATADAVVHSVGLAMSDAVEVAVAAPRDLGALAVAATADGEEGPDTLAGAPNDE